VQLTTESVRVKIRGSPDFEFLWTFAKQILTEAPTVVCTPARVEIVVKKAPAAHGLWLEHDVIG
jgi:hypothetical protein